MAQELIILVVFAAAVGYLISVLIRSFSGKTDCATGCGKCGAIDFSKIEKQIKEKGH